MGGGWGTGCAWQGRAVVARRCWLALPFAAQVCRSVPHSVLRLSPAPSTHLTADAAEAHKGAGRVVGAHQQAGAARVLRCERGGWGGGWQACGGRGQRHRRGPEVCGRRPLPTPPSGSAPSLPGQQAARAARALCVVAPEASVEYIWNQWLRGRRQQAVRTGQRWCGSCRSSAQGSGSAAT